MHAFVDESKQRGLLVVAAVLSSADVTTVRRDVERLHMPHQRRIHFKDESDGRKRTILDVLTAEPVKVRIYECPGERHELTAREACLTRIVEDLASVGGERLVIERTTPQSATTSGPCTRLSGSSASPGSLQYVHLRAKEETLLALPDAFAWCYAKGGEWRRRTQALLDEHVRL